MTDIERSLVAESDEHAKDMLKEVENNRQFYESKLVQVNKLFVGQTLAETVTLLGMYVAILAINTDTDIKSDLLVLHAVAKRYHHATKDTERIAHSDLN